MHPVVLFDDGKGQLSPLNDLRASFDIRTGALTLLERILAWKAWPVVAAFVPEPLAAITRERHPQLQVNSISPQLGDVLLVNGRWAGATEQGVHEAEVLGGYLAETDTAEPLCFRTISKDVPRIVAGDLGGCDPFWHECHSDQPQLLTRPWHIRTFRDRCIAQDLKLLSAPAAARQSGVTTIGEHPITVAPSAKLYPTVVLDAEHGPIVIAEHATIRPGAILIGPCYVGPHSTVLDRALIKANTAIGPHCRIAGEVGGTIFQGFANKAHDGHLGDSWVGEWANLGAGTTNSNLLNTYAEVICRAFAADGAPGPNERTGEQFLGAIIGDHVKFAINTRIMTGAIVGTGTMWAATAPVTGTIAPFSWVTDAGTRSFRLDKFLEVARAVMGRRKIVPSEAYAARLAQLSGKTG